MKERRMGKNAQGEQRISVCSALNALTTAGIRIDDCWCFSLKGLIGWLFTDLF